VQFFKLKYKIKGKLYLLSEVLPHPLTRASVPARSPAILHSLIRLIESETFEKLLP